MKAEWIHKIEQYLQKTISFDELSEYASGEGITDLEEKIEWVRNTELAFEADALRSQIKYLLSQDKAVHTGKKSARVFSMTTVRWTIGMAASFLLLFIGYQSIDHLSPQNEYADYQYVDPGLPVVMSQSDNYALYDALTYYGEENYQVAINKLNALLENDIQSDTIYYYLGASYLYSDQPSLAVSPLQKSMSFDNSEFMDKAQWLLIIAHLKNVDIMEARRLLDSVLNDADHPFYDKATSLKQELQSN